MSRIAWTIVVLRAVTSVAAAAELAPTPDEFLIPQATPTVDGDLAEWSIPAAGLIIDPTQAGQAAGISLHVTDPDNPIAGVDDLGAVVALAWDDQHLFLAAIVTDDDLRGIKPASPHNVGPPGWKCDSVMVQIHSFRQPLKTNSPYTPSPNLNARYEVAPGGRGELVENVKGVLDTPDAYWKLPEGSVLSCRETADGYQLEAAMPWSGLGYRPQAGERLHCSFLLGDMDGGEKLNQLGWHFSETANGRAVFRLLGRPETTGVLSLSASQIEVGGRLSMSYRVDARAAGVQLERVVLTGAGGEVGSTDISLPVPQGQTATDLVTFQDLPEDPGAYQATLEGTVGGEKVAICAEAFEILPRAEPPPLVATRAGEISHMRPDRVAHTAFEDGRRGVIRHDFVSDRSGYERYIQTHVRDYLDRNMEPALAGGWGQMTHYAIQAYTLHKLTGEEKHADWTRRALTAVVERLREKRDDYTLFTLAEARYHIWLHDPDTDLAPPGIEQDFQELWAREASVFDEGWMFSEWGYHNRCLHRLGLQKIGAHFAQKLGQPVSPKIEEYMAWHEPIHAQFGATTDSSTNYYWVALRYPVWWHMAFDTLDELAGHEGWQAALDNWRRYSAPSGAVPNFGDTSGWNTGAGRAMAYYELMTRLTGDGHFRWQAHRIAESLYNHFWPRHDQYHVPRDNIALAFCRAWLFADDAVEPVSPSQRSAVTFRTRVVAATPEDKAARPGWSGQKLVDEQVPDKLVLTSGNDPRRLWGLVELLDNGGHYEGIPGNIITLMQHDAALLAGQGYYERAPDFNNIMWLEDMEGLAADPRPMRAEVPRFVEDGAVTYARIRVPRFRQMPVTYERDIVFVKNAFMLVKDRMTFESTMKVRLGPCWQTRDLGPQSGSDWVNMYYNQIYYTGLGLGRGIHAYRNPAWDLLVRFAPRDETRLTVLDRYDDNPYRTSGTQVRQSWSGIAGPGDTKTFTTILLPHAPGLNVEPYAQWAQFVLDDDDTTLVRVTTEFDNLNHLQESHWLLLQEDAAMIEVDGFQSDATLALVTTGQDGKLRPAVMVEGTALSLDGEDLTLGARAPAVEAVYELAE